MQCAVVKFICHTKMNEFECGTSLSKYYRKYYIIIASTISIIVIISVYIYILGSGFKESPYSIKSCISNTSYIVS